MHFQAGPMSTRRQSLHAEAASSGGAYVYSIIQSIAAVRPACKLCYAAQLTNSVMLELVMSDGDSSLIPFKHISQVHNESVWLGRHIYKAAI